MAEQVTSNKTKPNYGIDAPGVIRNLFLGGAAFAAVSIFFPHIRIGSVNIDATGLIWSGLGCALGGVLMLAYSLSGKYKHRDRMLNLITWTGNEHVLDIGTGRGLLMIGAAKRLTTGRSSGIDIWNAEDLSANNIENATQNAKIEGVADKIEILNENVMSMNFADNSFDVILTNMVIHNIYDKAGRKKACEEIVRVLKPGGKGIIADFRHVSEYKKNFDEIGVKTEHLQANYLTTFPAVGMVVITKV
jgi:ubiquinone/menaquinone biosynthesis C-methylase UbiE